MSPVFASTPERTKTELRMIIISLPNPAKAYSGVRMRKRINAVRRRRVTRSTDSHSKVKSSVAIPKVPAPAKCRAT
jgi:hypothetical protein